MNLKNSMQSLQKKIKLESYLSDQRRKQRHNERLQHLQQLCQLKKVCNFCDFARSEKQPKYVKGSGVGM